MNGLLMVVAMMLALSVTGYSGEPSGIQAVEAIVARPEDKIDIGLACLTLAQEVYPRLSIEEFDRILDHMAERIAQLSRMTSYPEQRIGLLNTYFFRPGWWNDSIVFTYDLDDLDASQLDNRYLNGYLATRKGSCVTMSMLYLAIADRLHWPIVPVRGAKHVFCRYRDPGFTENNIEPTCGGGYLPDSQYVATGNIPPRGIRNGVYMRSLSKKEYIATLISNHALQLIEWGRLERAKEYLELAIRLDSTLSTAYWNLGQWYCHEVRVSGTPRKVPMRTKGQSGSAVKSAEDVRHRARGDEFKARARHLGIVLRLPERFFRRQAESIEMFKKTGEY